MSAFPREALLSLATDERVSQIIADAIDAYDVAAYGTCATQRALTIAHLAYEWAKARRARLTLGPVRLQPCDTEPNAGTCIDSIRDGFPLSPCAPCAETMDRMATKKRTAQKLSGLSARLERACLGPREKKGASDV